MITMEQARVSRCATLNLLLWLDYWCFRDGVGGLTGRENFKIFTESSW